MIWKTFWRHHLTEQGDTENRLTLVHGAIANNTRELPKKHKLCEVNSFETRRKLENSKRNC